MRTKSKRSRKSKKVSWASGDNLHQVKLFLSEDCPAIVGLKSRDDLHSETSSSDTTRSNDVPPGFRRESSSTHSGLEPSFVAQIRWKSPPKFVLSHTWQVASGEESEEVKQQNSRELKVLEAIYPRNSNIPFSPSVSSEVEKEHYDDVKTPLVPLIPIEEEESVDGQCDFAVPQITAATIFHPPEILPLDFAGAATATLAEVIRTSNDKENLIDTDLLIKILSDKNMIHKLMVNGPPPVPEPRMVNLRPTPSVNFPPLLNGNSFITTVPNQPVKDVNYYKNLIRQHGEDKQENGKNRQNYFHHHCEIKQARNSKPVELKTKNSKKPCMYFKSSRGCLKGVNCPFQHEDSVQWRPGDVMESHSAKRMRLSGEINRGMLV